MGKELVLVNEGLHYSSLELDKNEVHGNWVVFQQSFPDFLLGHTSERFMLREQDIDKVIEFLQQAKAKFSNQ